MVHRSSSQSSEISTKSKDVLQSHPLYLIVRMLRYDDGPGVWEEPAGSQDHRRQAAGVEHLRVPVEQHGTRPGHLQGVVRLLRLCAHIREVLKSSCPKGCGGDGKS